MKLQLQAQYSQGTLLLCGLDAKTQCEVYKFVDLARNEIDEWTVDNAELREGMLDFLRSHLPESAMPYGFTEHVQLLPYFLHPHAFAQPDTGEIAVSFKQAPYLRLLDRREHRATVAPGRVDFSTAFSSTNTARGDAILLSRTSSIGRLQRYSGAIRQLACDLLRYRPADNVFSRVGAAPEFVIDSAHQVAESSAGFIVAVDMNLSVEVAERSMTAADALESAESVAYYASQPFPKSRFVVYDLASERSVVVEPGTACAAHVDFDARDPSTFFLTCHNISKWQNKVVVHGPGAVEKYRYVDGRVEKLAEFRDLEFFRITSHTLLRGSQRLLAVTVFPNKLYLIEPAEMRLVRSIELFPHAQLTAPFVCDKNSVAPLYLAQSENDEYLFLTGASTLFVVSLREHKLVDRVEFCAPGTFLATAHIGFVDPF